MKLPAIEPFDQCQNCQAEMVPLVVDGGAWWCSKCGTLAAGKNQWVPKSRVETILLARLEAANKRLTEKELPEGPK